MKKVCISLLITLNLITTEFSYITADENHQATELAVNATPEVFPIIADMLITLCNQAEVPVPEHLVALLEQNYPTDEVKSYCLNALKEIHNLLTILDESTLRTGLEECKKIVLVTYMFFVDELEHDSEIIAEALELLKDSHQQPVTKGPKEIFCNLFVKNLLKVCGQAFIEGQLTINPRQRTTRASSYPLLVVNGDADINGTLTVDDLIVLGTSEFGDIVFDDATVTGNLTVAGATTLNNLSVTNNTTIGGTLNVTGDTTVNNLTVNGTLTAPNLGDTTINGTLTVTGATTLQSTLDVTGNTSLSTLSTSGLATLNSASVSTTLSVTGNTSLSTLSTSGLATVNSLSVTPGDATFAANINMANTTNANVGVIEKNNLRFIHNFGTNNTFVGASSGNFTTSGSNNAAFGTGTGFFLAAASSNTLVGASAGFALSSGDGNSLFGNSAATTLSSGNNNTFLGFGTGTNFASGDNNIVVGANAGVLSDGSNNILIGTPGPIGTLNTHIFLGSQTQTNFFLMSNAGGGTSLPAQVVGGTVQNMTINSATGNVGRDTSSARYKTNIVSLPDESTEILESLRPVQYSVKHSNNAQAYGLIAEEVADIDQILVSFDNEHRPDGVHYQMLIPILIKAYQQQQKRIEDLERRISQS